MSYRVAKSLEVLRFEFNAAYPKRDKASDGSIGDADHSSRASDHNPNSAGVVCARDFDEDLVPSGGGALMEGVVQRILAAARAGGLPQLNYVIYERRIWSRKHGFSQWPYSGKNAHAHHAHVSVMQVAALYDRTAPWGVVTGRPVGPRTTLQQGDSGEDVKELQRLLPVAPADGDFGPVTKVAVIAFQTKNSLVANGVAGPTTLAALRAGKGELTVSDVDKVLAQLAKDKADIGRWIGQARDQTTWREDNLKRDLDVLSAKLDALAAKK